MMITVYKRISVIITKKYNFLLILYAITYLKVLLNFNIMISVSFFNPHRKNILSKERY